MGICPYKGLKWLKLGYDITAGRILTRVLNIGQLWSKPLILAPNTPNNSLRDIENGQEYVKNAKLVCYWAYIGVVWVIFRI